MYYISFHQCHVNSSYFNILNTAVFIYKDMFLELQILINIDKFLLLYITSSFRNDSGLSKDDKIQLIMGPVI